MLKRILGSITLMIWLGTLAFVAGPVRWEFAHTYDHWMEGLGDSLPSPTKNVGLPFLGLGHSSLAASILIGLFWAIAWLSPVGLLIGIWRTRSDHALSDWLLYGGALYCSLMFLASVVILLSLWLPFALLGD